MIILDWSSIEQFNFIGVCVQRRGVVPFQLTNFNYADDALLPITCTIDQTHKVFALLKMMK